MTHKPSPVSRTLGLVFGMSVLLAACGGSQAPAESAEASPAAESGSGDSTDGEHTMPDGTKMKGDEHGEHTMPDGTKMKGDEHGSAESQGTSQEK